MIKIVPFISGTGTNFIAIHNACKSGKIDGRVILVISDNPKAEGLEFAAKENIPIFIADYITPTKQCKGDLREIEDAGLIPSNFNLRDVLCKERIRPLHERIEKKIKYFYARAIVEAQIISELAKHPFDLVVLAGFMRIFTPHIINVVNIFPEYPRIMNIHPALLPAFPGTNGYGDTFNYGCKVGGCTVHFVDYGEDTGPIIGQKSYEIYPSDTLEIIKKRGLKNEHELYPECIQLFAEGRLKVVEKNGRKIVEIRI
jgi:phosphoribosylglycinamide formyltransferase-1